MLAHKISLDLRIICEDHVPVLPRILCMCMQDIMERDKLQQAIDLLFSITSPSTCNPGPSGTIRDAEEPGTSSSVQPRPCTATGKRGRCTYRAFRMSIKQIIFQCG